jgi:8-oxo-dGTP diphosphatase
LIKDEDVLLGIKARKIGAGLWNGYGGKIEPGETIRQAASRELQKEVGISVPPDKLIKCAVVDFHNLRPSGRGYIFQVHVYLATEWMGHPQETDEMKSPTWWKINQLPIKKMMLADRKWLKLVLEGKKFEAEFWYGPGQKTLRKNCKIKEVNFSSDD